MCNSINIRGSNKKKLNVILISVSPDLRSSSCVFSAFSRFLSFCFSSVIAILPSIRKTFNLAPLNISDIKSYSIVRTEVGKAVNNPLCDSLLGQRGNRTESGTNEIRRDQVLETIE